MSSHPLPALATSAQAMKRDWNARALENAMWFINTVKPAQTEAEFDASGREAVEYFLPELSLLAEGRVLKSLRLLEIGCGIGRMTKPLAQLFGEVHATDVSGEMIRRARARLRDAPNVHCHETNGVDLAALPDEHFDVVFSAYVFQHVPDKDVIRANLREAFRVLKPGGVFGFQTNSVEADEYEALAKDTWSGASFTAAEIRATARELGAQLLAIYGAGTGYCWAKLRKRLRPAAKVGTPRIEAYARADDAERQRIPAGGADACVALLVSGLDRESVDVESLSVELNKQSVTPRYVGRARLHFEPWLRACFGERADELVYVEAQLPADVAGAFAQARVRLADGTASAPLPIELEASQPHAPRIVTVRNAVDYSIEVHACGPKARLRLFVEDLNESATCRNVRLRVNDFELIPTFVGFVAETACYQVEAALPENIAPGEHRLALLFDGIASGSVSFAIHDATLC